MKKLILCSLMFLCCSSWGNIAPQNSFTSKSGFLSLELLAPPPPTMYFGETIRIPMVMKYYNLGTRKYWSTLPLSFVGLELAERTGDKCPWLGGNKQSYDYGVCHMNIIINGYVFQNLSININYTADVGSWYTTIPVFPFIIKVIPHRLSMTTIPQQKATANIRFEYNIKNAVHYYEENRLGGQNTTATIDPISKQKLNNIGLSFYPETLSISGTPNQTGTFEFKIGATNKLSTSAYTTLTINIGVNPKDKPIFKTDNKNIPIATASKKYSLDMMSLIKPKAGFMVSNQIKFSIDPNQARPSWLQINPNNPTLLEGIPDINDAGKELKVTLIATSNTGGASNPTLTITIPVAFDSERKPEIKYFEMEQLPGSQIFRDLSSLINDPAHDPSLKVSIDKIVPAIDWLNISGSNPLMLEGSIPSDAVGQKYLITLKANTKAGGPSKAITVPLQVSLDERLTPQFKRENPIMNMVYPGQPYFYDFVEYKDVFPEYDDIPYTIKFAKNSNHPSWLKIENNKLISELVPDTVKSNFDISLVISNLPGGESIPIKLFLIVMR